MLHTEPDHAPSVPLQYCLECDKTFYCHPDETLHRLRGEWPVCCGREVVFNLGVDRDGREVRGFWEMSAGWTGPLPLGY